MRRRSWGFAGRALALVGWVAFTVGCGGESDSSDVAPPGGGSADTAATGSDGPVRGDWLVVHILSDAENLNPLTGSDATGTTILNYIFPSLLTLDNETLEQRPLLAASLPEISDDKLTYTFRLRPDATFSDGKPVTAQDVVFTMKAVKNPVVGAPHYRNYLNSVRDVVAVDDTTVRFDLRERYFRNDLVLGGVAPMPRHYYDPEGLLEGISVAEVEDFDNLPPDKRERAKKFAEQFNRDYQRNPMGPGAFALRDPERDVVTGERVVLRRRDDFWAPNDPDYGDAWVNRVVFKVVNDSEAALVSFKRGDLDYYGLTPLQHTRDDTNSDKFLAKAHKKEHTSAGYTYIGWNQKKKIMQDPRVRRAFGYFVDKQAIIKTVLFGLGEPIEGPIFRRRPEYNENLAPYPFDPAKGKALLAEAGWTDSDKDGILDKEIDGERVPLSFEIISNSGNDTRKSVGLAVIDQMKRAGIAASFRELDWSIMLEKVRKFDFDAVILGWRMGVTAPDMYQIWHSSQAVEDGSNHVFYRNPELDQILEEYRREFDYDKRKAMYDRAQEILYEDQPYTFLYMSTAVSAYDRRFRGVTWYPSGSTDTNEWWVASVDQKYTQ